MAEFHAPVSYDPVTGVKEEMWYDDRDRKIHVKRTTHVDHVYKQNKIQLASSPRDFRKDDGMYHKARIPNIVIERWLKHDGFDWYNSTDEERRRKLNQHPEFHVRKGQL